MDDSSPFALLVNAASNAQNQKHPNEMVKAPDARSAQAQQGIAHQRQPTAADYAAYAEAEAQQRLQQQQQRQQQHQISEMELQEAIQRETLQREALQRRAALMGMGGGQGLQGLPPQEAEYLQQLRLEALVQQRRQETLAQLALAQEAGMKQDLQSLLNAQQLRQAAIMRQELLLGGGGGFQGLEQYGAMAGRMGGNDENLLLQLFAEREREQKMAAFAAAVPSAHMNGMEGKLGPEHVGSGYGNPRATAVPDVEREQMEALRDGSKTTFLPCRARGMPMDHNVKTAYFVIPEDIKHGTELVCSYYACQNAGIKFRYCTYCKLPVAKRNFCKRHKHTGKIPASSLPEGGVDDDMSSSTGTQEQEKKIEKLAIKPPAAIKREHFDAKMIIQQLMVVGAKDFGGLDDSLPKTPFSPEESERRARKRRGDWEHLLTKRPRSLDAAVSWAQKVLDISDLDSCILEEDDDPLKRPPSVSAECQSSDSKEKGKEAATMEVDKEPVKEKKNVLDGGKKGESEREVRESDKNEEPKVEKKQVPEITRTAPPVTERKCESGMDKNSEEDASNNNTEGDDNGDDKEDPDDMSETKSKEEDEISDDGSTSSDDSVDLRASKKTRGA